MASKEPSHESKIKAFDIEELLRKKYAFLTGGKDRRNNLIITIPGDSKITKADEADVETVFKYLLSLPRQESATQEFTIVLDRRRKSWKSVNTVLTKLKTFPSPVNCIFVLKPEGIRSRFIGSLNCVEAQATFKIVLLGNVADLEEYIDQDQLSTDLGGNLEYKHEEWIENRNAIEGFENKVADISEKLKRLKGKRAQTQIKSSIQEMELTLKSMENQWQIIQGQIEDARTSRTKLMFKPKKDDNTVASDVKANLTAEVEGLLKKLNDSEEEFVHFWENQETRIRQEWGLWRLFQLTRTGQDAEDVVESITGRWKKIVEELVKTEEDYLASLLSIIRGYIRKFDKATDQIPPNLYKKDNIFGNIEQIYKFHNEEFLKELETCVNDPLLVGEVFLEKKKDFETIYASYCNNKPASEALQQDFINLPFVKECQSKLGHKLPLSAYLLEPVQRITNYQLLLEKMMKITPKDRNAKLTEALEFLKSVRRHANDVMHSMCLRSYRGNLAKSKLVLQDSLSVRHENEEGNVQLRGRPRQVFLYEKMVIFAERKEDSDCKTGFFYQYEKSLKLNETKLSTTKRKPTRFALKSRSEVFTFQAESQEEKDLWVDNIQVQFLKSRLVRVKESGSSSDEDSIFEDDGCVSDGFISHDSNRDQHTPQGSSAQPPQGQSPPFGEHGTYTAVAEFFTVGLNEMPLRLGQVVEVSEKSGDGQWWYARDIASQQEGWVPVNCLEPTVSSQ